MKLIGIDPGVNTGVAIWDTELKRFELVTTMQIDQAIIYLNNYFKTPGALCVVYVENPKTFVPFKNQDPKAIAARKQGAGSIKRDFKIWVDFCTNAFVGITEVSLHASLKKTTAQEFTKLTGWKEKTSVHARDAAMLVFGRK